MTSTTKLNVIQMNIKILRMYRMWPRKGQEAGLYFTIRAFLIFPMFGFMFYTSMCHLGFNIYYNKSLEIIEIIEDIIMSISFIVILYIKFCIVLNRNEINSLVEALGDFSVFGKPDNAEAINSKTDFYVKLHGIYTSVGCIVYGLFGFFETESCENIKNINHSLNVCGLMSNSWLPYDIDYTPVKHIILFLQVVATLAELNIGSCSVNIVLACAEILIVRIDHFILQLNTVFKYEQSERKQNVIRCIEYHNQIIELTNQMDKCYRSMLFIHISISAVMVSCVSYICFVSHSLKHVLFLIGCLIAIFIVCHAGQRLQNKSRDISQALYNIDWYNEEPSLQNDLMLMLLRSQKELKLHGGSFGVMSMDSFKLIMQSIYSYMALLNTTVKAHK